MTCPA
jgi:hypothetical protein